MDITTYGNLNVKLISALLDDGWAGLRSLIEELDVSVMTISNHLRDLEDEGVIESYTLRMSYGTPGYDVTAAVQPKVEGSALPEIAERLRAEKQMISVYEVTDGYDIIVIGKLRDIDDTDAQIRRLLTSANTREPNTSVAFNAVTENEQFDLDLEE